MTRRPAVDPARPTAVVIGAGFAGLSAAIRLADQGCRVIVLDRAPRGGGRASVFTDNESGERVDNGQHVLFGCYRETYAFLRRLGTDALAPLQSRLSLMMADEGRVSELTCPSLTPPLHLLAGVLKWRALSVSDRLSALRVGGLIARARRRGPSVVAAEVPEAMTVATWLDTYRQSARLREWLWYPLAYAALNQAPETASAAPFVRVVAELFGPRVEDAAVGLSRVPLDELYVVPAFARLGAAGGEVHLKTAGQVLLDDHGRVCGVRTAQGDHPADLVVSAVPWHAFGGLWPDGVPPPLQTIAARAAGMDGSPIVTVNLWLNAHVLPGPFLGLVRGPMHWVFDKRAIIGDRASHVSIVASGATSIVDEDNAGVTASALAQLSRALPGIRPGDVRRAVVVREPRATFSLAPGQPRRPGTITPVDGLFLAGDWTDTQLPATIEGAVLSGHRAADAAVAWLAR